MTTEQMAQAVGDDPVALRQRLRDARAVLHDDLRRRMGTGTFDAAGKRLVAADGTFWLQWRLRHDPTRPEATDNQQSSRGAVCVEWLDTRQ